MITYKFTNITLFYLKILQSYLDSKKIDRSAEYKVTLGFVTKPIALVNII